MDMLQPDALRSMATRVGLIAAAIWLVLGLVAGFAQSSTTKIIALSLAGALTAALVGIDRSLVGSKEPLINVPILATLTRTLGVCDILANDAV